MIVEFLSFHSGFIMDFDEATDIMLALFLLLSILVWNFSECDLFQVTGTDADCVLYIFSFSS